MEHDADFDRRAAAYHQAGHAVLAYWFGWWLNDEGVEIDDRQHAGTRRLSPDDSTEAAVIQALAGWLCEHKWHGQGHARLAIEEVFELARDHDPEDEEFRHAGDLADVALTLLRTNPEITPKEFVKAFWAYGDQAEKILAEEPVWRAVEKLASALLASGSLSDEEAREAIGDLPIFGRGCKRLVGQAAMQKMAERDVIWRGDAFAELQKIAGDGISAGSDLTAELVAKHGLERYFRSGNDQLLQMSRWTADAGILSGSDHRANKEPGRARLEVASSRREQ